MESMNPRFKRDWNAVLNFEHQEVLTRRRNELDEIDRQGRREKNSFARQCLAQEYSRLHREYEMLAELAEEI